VPSAIIPLPRFMDPTLRFVIFGVFSSACLWGGYVARKRGWLDETVSRPIHFHTVVWTWSLAALFSLWKTPLQPQDLWLIVMQTAIVAAAGFGAIPVARLCGCTREQTGVIAIASSVGNFGFTLGAYLCYTLLDDGAAALTLAIVYVSIMQVAGVILIYPLARHYAGRSSADTPLWRLIAANFIDPRGLPLWGAVAGAVLAHHVPFPRVVREYPLLDILFFVGAFGGYFGIGLRLRLGRSLHDWKAHAIVAGMKFAFIPLLTLAMLRGIGLVGSGLGPTARQVVLVCSCMPAAIWVPMMANLFHLDIRLAGSVWLWNTILFLLIPLPVLLWLLA